MKIGVTYAVYISHPNLLTLAIDTLSSVKSEHELSFLGVLNHPLEDRSPLEQFGPLIENDENNLSRAWNRGIHRLLNEGCDYVFVCNLDIVLAPGALDHLIDHARPESILWTMSPWSELESLDQAYRADEWVPHPHFSAYMVDHRLFEEVGPFDENFRPAYNEDLDMHWRIRLAGHDATRYEGARFYHYGSATLRHDPDLMMRNQTTHAMNNEYFARKWYYKPPTANDPFTDGMYRVPFNDPQKVGFERQVMGTW